MAEEESVHVDVGDAADVHSVTYSAPGKLILFGEHAVVYGKRAVACALGDLRLWVRVSMWRESGAAGASGRAGGRVRITLRSGSLEGAEGGSVPGSTGEWAVSEVLEALAEDVRGCGVERAPKPDLATAARLEAVCGVSGFHGMVLKAMLPLIYLATSAVAGLQGGEGVSAHVEVVRSTLPVAAGLGSSAALSVATAAGLLHARALLTGEGAGGAAWTVPSAHLLSRVNAWAFAGEGLFHGTPSGLDNSVATYGGVVGYRRGTREDESPWVEAISRPPELPALICNTRIPKDTRRLVDGVRALRERYPAIVNPILDSVDAVSSEALSVFERAAGKPAGSAAVESAAASVAELISVNHALLNAIGVGHPALDAIVAAARTHGCAAKLTGAGGGGCAIVLLSSDARAEEPRARLEAALRALGFDCFSTSMGGPGVQRHIE